MPGATLSSDIAMALAPAAPLIPPSDVEDHNLWMRREQDDRDVSVYGDEVWTKIETYMLKLGIQAMRELLRSTQGNSYFKVLHVCLR